MSDRPQSIPSTDTPTPPAFPPGVAVPAVISPPRFEDFEGFRETTLCVFTDPQANATLRGLGGLLYEMALEYTAHWPHEPCGSFFHQCRAVLADLRHLQGWPRGAGFQRWGPALLVSRGAVKPWLTR